LLLKGRKCSGDGVRQDDGAPGLTARAVVVKLKQAQAVSGEGSLRSTLKKPRISLSCS
jgi:hypothetical protein